MADLRAHCNATLVVDTSACGMACRALNLRNCPLHWFHMQPSNPSPAALLAMIDGKAMLEQVCQWSALNSGTGNLAGLSQQAGLLADSFSALPGDLRLERAAPVQAIAADGQAIAQDFGAHLVLTVRPGAARRVLLTGHMDTVYAADSPFQSLRWLDSTTLNGPGVADMKGGLAVILAALTAFEHMPGAASLGYDVLVNADEEIGSLSSAPLLSSLARDKAAALTYEPASLPDGTLAGSRSGSGNYSVVVTGRSAHAGRNPEQGRNALVAAAALAVALTAFATQDLSVNPARIDGGSANNVVPDQAILRFNVRPRTINAATRFSLQLDGLLARLGKEHDVAMHLHGGMTRPPKPLDAPATRLFELVRDCGRELGQDIAWQHSGGVCDGNNIAACGVPVVDTMGVRGGAIHSPDEYLIVPSLVERAALSALVLHRLATGVAL